MFAIPKMGQPKRAFVPFLYTTPVILNPLSREVLLAGILQKILKKRNQIQLRTTVKRVIMNMEESLTHVRPKRNLRQAMHLFSKFSSY